MDQIPDYADPRLINNCIYCGWAAETRDHVPSRVMLEKPYPENLPVVGACRDCNEGFSKDEQYLVCLLQVVIAGSTDPDKIERPTVARALKRSPALRARLKNAKQPFEGKTQFEMEKERVENVMLKLARGHAAFELSQPCKSKPDHIWFGAISELSREEREQFDLPHNQKLLGEIGSRGMQRMIVAQAKLESVSGKTSVIEGFLNPWVDVQEGNYRYLAFDDSGWVMIRIVLMEYLACEIGWQRSY